MRMVCVVFLCLALVVSLMACSEYEHTMQTQDAYFYGTPTPTSNVWTPADGLPATRTPVPTREFHDLLDKCLPLDEMAGKIIRDHESWVDVYLELADNPDREQHLRDMWRRNADRYQTVIDRLMHPDSRLYYAAGERNKPYWVWETPEGTYQGYNCRSYDLDQFTE